MASIGAIDMGNLSAPGSAYIMALYRFSAYRKDTENYGIVRGGMGSITQSMARSRRVGRRVDPHRRGSINASSPRTARPPAWNWPTAR